ncbi:MAG: heavy metal translocating P-type ATPase [Spirochaetales bacterium]|nr:heavy metal translocating P-type ATPase [Spirochaetales bacterium]
MIKYNVMGMSCAACQARVQNAVSKVDGVTDCSVNLLTNSMTVDGDVPPDRVIQAVRKAGYDAAVPSAKKQEPQSAQSDEVRNAVMRLISSGVVLVVLMYFGMGLMFGAPDFGLKDYPVTLGIIQMILSGIILIINRRFFINGIKGIMHLSPNMDTLVALGSGVSYIYSTVILIMLSMDKHLSSSDYYFESAGMILVLITVGKLLEAIAKGRTTDALRALASLTPQNASVIRNGVELIIPIEELSVGDEIVIRPGENVSADGVIIHGMTSINESALTGESMPVNKSEGAQVYTGTINLNGVIHIRADKVGSDTALSKIIAMVGDAAAAKAPIARVADRVSGIFVPIVTMIAIITALIWLFAGQTVGFALARGICVLVISCPCALGLATPVAIMVGSGVAARHNILFKTAESLELTGRVRNVILDKTGTVTKGQPEITGIYPIGDADSRTIVQAAYSLERSSSHPLAAAVCRYAEAQNVTAQDVSNITETAGHGIRAVSQNGTPITVGSADMILAEITADNAKTALEETLSKISTAGQTLIAVAVGDQPIGIITFSDELKPDSIAAVSRMHSMGLSVCLLSGDNQAAADKVGNIIKADKIFGKVLPDQKAKIVAEIQQTGRVMMVGDGINDAVALTAADVGAAIGAGTDVAKDAADVVLVRDSLTDVAAAVRIGRAVLRNIYENLFWAFIYNIIGIPLAAGALYPLFGIVLTPAFGAAAMSLSSFCVVSNALRLNLLKFNKNGKSSPDDNSDKNLTDNKETSTMTKTLKIEGMMCGHCEATVKKALETIDGVKLATPSHTAGTAIVELSKDVADDVLKTAVEAKDYKVTGIV